MCVFGGGGKMGSRHKKRPKLSGNNSLRHRKGLAKLLDFRAMIDKLHGYDVQRGKLHCITRSRKSPFSLVGEGFAEQLGAMVSDDKPYQNGVEIMYRPNLKSLLLVALLTVSISAVAEQAQACWWWGCYRPAYVGSCCSACDPCGFGGNWVLGYRHGPVRRLLFGPYRWYYAGGVYTTSCCGEVTTSDCGCGGTTAPAAPAKAPTPAQKPATEAPNAPIEPSIPAEKTSSATPETSGILTVWVPADAKVTVNGLATKSVGSRRQFVSFGLKSGFSYKYEVVATVVRDGKEVEDTRTVILTAGSNTSVAFSFEMEKAEALAAN